MEFNCRRCDNLWPHRKGHYFGEYEILCDDPQVHPFTVRALQTTEMLLLGKDDFLEVMDMFPSAADEFSLLGSDLLQKERVTVQRVMAQEKAQRAIIHEEAQMRRTATLASPSAHF